MFGELHFRLTLNSMLHKKRVLLLGNTIQAISCFLAKVRPVPSDENQCIILNLTAYKARALLGGGKKIG